VGDEPRRVLFSLLGYGANDEANENTNGGGERDAMELNSFRTRSTTDLVDGRREGSECQQLEMRDVHASTTSSS